MAQFLKVLIDYDGELNNGLVSCTHSEGRWLLNLAKMLLDYGHEVDLLTLWPWEVERQNLHIITDINPTKNYDFYFHRGWSPELPDPRIKANINIIATFELEFLHYDKTYQIDLLKQPNWILAHGYPASEEYFSKSDNPFRDKTVCLPAPISKEFWPSGFNRSSWIANTRWTEAAFSAAETRAYGEPTGTFALAWRKGLEVLKSLLGQPISYPVNGSLCEIYGLMGKTKFLGSLIQGGITNLEGPFFGVVPLFVYFPQGIRPMPHTFPSYAPKELGLYFEHPIRLEEIREAVNKLIIDKTWYNKVLNLYRVALKDHEWSRAYQRFTKELEFKGG